MTPRVTVLMTVYNGMPYLPQAVESILGQSLEDFEIVIIDDASTDGSVACLEQYADPRIRLFRNDHNIGQAHSLNRGLALCRTPFVARLDQDDVCLPDRLQQQVSLLERRPDVHVVGTWVYYLSADGRKRSLVGMPVEDYGAFLGTLFTYATPFGHPTVMFRRETVLERGGYDTSFAPCEDYALWCDLALNRCGAVSLPHPLVMLRLHGQQQSKTRLALQQQQARRAHEALVTTLHPGREAPLVSALLRMDESFWERCGSIAEVRAALTALDGTLAAARQSLRLSSREEARLARRVAWWLGHGALLAILHQQRQSRSVVAWALRRQASLLPFPAFLLYPGCFLLSPLFVPHLRQVCVDAATTLGRQKYIVRLFIDELKGWIHRQHRVQLPRVSLKRT